ncbi:MAG: hypothetical protein WDN46_00195 [Methylocella sp.]
MGRIRSAIAENHGTVIDAYIEYLISLDKLKSHVETHMSTFMSKVSVPEEDGAALHAARNFALVYAGGMLAFQAGFLPWRKANILDAVATCFNDGYSLLLSRQGGEDLAKQNVKKNVEIIKNVRVKSPSTKEFSIVERGGQKQIFMRATVFAKWFANWRVLLNALKAVDSAGALIKPNTVNALRRGTGYEWAVSTPRWPDHTKQKTIVIRYDI